MLRGKKIKEEEERITRRGDSRPKLDSNVLAMDLVVLLGRNVALDAGAFNHKWEKNCVL
jgi:hypothetical protein